MTKDEALRPMQVPLHELLASVPSDARLVIEDADGCGTRFIPVGRYCQEASVAIKQASKQPERESVTVLPDGSAFAVMSYPLPKDHWLYAERQYNDGDHEPVELGKAILTHEMRDAVVSAVRYAIRGATNCGKENDFDPDALVQNAVYALCGPYTSPPKREPLTDEQIKQIELSLRQYNTRDTYDLSLRDFARAIEQAHGIGEKK